MSSWLAHDRARWAIILLALALCAPSLASGLLLDDHVLALKATPEGAGHIDGLAREPFALFTFTTGDPRQNRALMEQGALLPWWSEPRHLNAFLRPLSSLSHVVDFRLWPEAAPLMHLHSLLWYALLLLAVAGAYAALEREPAAQPPAALIGLALLLYALDDAHGATLGWVANRNALIAGALALPALAAHQRASEASATGRRGPIALALRGPLWFGLGLAAGEAAVSVFGYLVAHAIWLDRRSWLRRCLALAPYAALLAVHRAVYHVLGLGSFGSSGYHDPLREPLSFLRALAYNLPVLLSAEVSLPLADFAFWGDPAGRPLLWALSLAGLGSFAWLVRGVLRADARARFWATGLVLSAIPVSASVPGERLLLLVGVGACPLFARVFFLWCRPRGQPAAPAACASPTTALFALGLLLVQLVISPVLLPVRAYGMAPLGAAIARLDAGLPESAAVRGQTAIVLNAPFTAMLSYVQVARAVQGRARPEHLYVLASASSALRVERTGPRTLRVELERGFLYRPEETHYRADPSALGRSGAIELAGMRVSVRERMADGRPKLADFDFDEPLDSERYLLRAYRDGRLAAWTPPAPGRSERFPRQDFFEIVLGELAW